MKGKILNFLHKVEKVISVISISVQTKKLNCPSSITIELIVKGQKYIFCSNFFSIKISKT